MKQETSFRRNWKVSLPSPPPASLTNGQITARVPQTSDIETLTGYGANKALLAGLWVGWPNEDEHIADWAKRSVTEWQLGWTREGSDLGPALIIDGPSQFLGIVHLFPKSESLIELLYGVLPTSRNQGIASQAVKLVSDWILDARVFEEVELRISAKNLPSQRVAIKSGFNFIEQYKLLITGTGETAIDCLYTKN